MAVRGNMGMSRRTKLGYSTLLLTIIILMLVIVEMDDSEEIAVFAIALLGFLLTLSGKGE